MKPWLSVIGIGEEGVEGLSGEARALLAGAELLVGGERHLAMIDGASTADRCSWDRPLQTTVARILERRGRPVVVLATGDPMHYGIGVTLAKAIPADEMRVLPAI